jgi:hypothetical protein
MNFSLSICAFSLLSLFALISSHAAPAERSEAMQSCTLLYQNEEVNNVLNAKKYTNVITLSAANNYSSPAYEAFKNGPADVFKTIEFKVNSAATKRVNVFKMGYKKEGDQRSNLMFWLEKEQECLVPLELMHYLDTSSIAVYARIRE